MIAQVLGEVPDWVADGGSWVGFLVGLGTVIVLAYGFARWLRRGLVHAVGELVDEKVDPLRADIAEATAEARQVHDELRTHMREEERLASQSAEWRSSVDIALRNLQQDAADRAVRDRKDI